jgi:hypothetical protein
VNDRRVNGLRHAIRTAWSECGNFDYSDGWVECRRCLASFGHSEDSFDWSDEELAAEELLHSTGLCLVRDELHRVLWNLGRSCQVVVAGNGDEEPF